MSRLIKTLSFIAALTAATWFAAHWYAGYRVRTAFAEAGMSDKAARCMSHRLLGRLSLRQIGKLAALSEEKHSVRGLLRAVRKIDDGEVVSVTAGSALLCTTGLAR